MDNPLPYLESLIQQIVEESNRRRWQAKKTYYITAFFAAIAYLLFWVFMIWLALFAEL
jgi:hypothetical protein